MKPFLLPLLSLLLALPSWSQITQSIILPATGQAANTSVPPCPGDCRIEFLIQNLPGTVDNSSIVAAGNTGLVITYLAGTPGSLQLYWQQGNSGSPSSTCTGNPALLPLSGLSTAIYVRAQKTVAGTTSFPALTSTFEAWDASGNYLTLIGGGNSCTYNGVSGSYGTGESIGDLASTISTKVAFFRQYPTLLPLQSTMPVTTPPGATISSCPIGATLEWKFDNSLTDSCGSYTPTLTNTPCAALACYTSTGAIQNLLISIPQVAALPFPGSKTKPSWSPWITLRTGSIATLDGSGSFSQSAASSAVSYLWTQTQGATATLSSTTAAAPTLTPPSDTNCSAPSSCLDYKFSLAVTDSNADMATTTLEFGSVTMNAAGVLVPADSKVTEIFGPMIAFGQNPWEQADQVQQSMIGLQTTYQAATNDFGWAITGQGTVSYPFSGKGPLPGPSATTLSSGITSIATTIPITNASALSLSGLPGEATWVLIGNTYTVQELVRICSTSATSGAANLTVCYDGRGMSGNNINSGGAPQTVPAQSWSGGVIVGEYRVQGSGTLFSTDSARPICPSGLPGPPGPVAYSTGTVTLIPSGTTISGSGVTWNSANGVLPGGWIRITATHASGTPFIVIRQIITIPGTTSLTVDHALPSDVDAGPFSYKITSPAIFLSLEFEAPNGTLAYPANHHTARVLQNILGCESETAMFAQLEHDIPALNSIIVSGAKFSYKTKLTEISSSGTFDPNFYGVALAADNFYFRSGYTPAATLAASINDYWPRDPQLADGFVGGQPLALGGGILGAMAALVLHSSSTLLSWPNVEQHAVSGEIGALSCNDLDTRTDGVLSGFLTQASNYDTNSTNQAAWTAALLTVLTKDQTCKRNAIDGYTLPERNSFANGFTWNPNGLLTPATLNLTASTNVTGSGFTNFTPGTGFPNYVGATQGYCYGVDIVTIRVTTGLSTFLVLSGSLSQQSLLWFHDGTNTGVFEYTISGSAGQLSGIWTGSSGDFSAMSTGGGPILSGGQIIGGFGSIAASNSDTLANNHLLKEAWACKFISATQLTLYRPWPSTPGPYQISYYNIGGFGQQPFFLGGYKTNQIRWATNSANSTIRSGYQTIAPLIGEWFNTYGYDSLNNRGTFYDTIYLACGAPTDLAAGTFQSIHASTGCAEAGRLAGAAGDERINSAEGGSAMLQYYLAECTLGTAQCAAASAIIDRFYGAIWGGSLTLCSPSVISTCDGTQIPQLASAYMAGSKWPGFFFGMGGQFASAWPAMRISTTSTTTLSGGVRFYGGVSVH